MTLQHTQTGKRIAFVSAQWHGDIVTQARESFLTHLDEFDVDTSSVDHIEVPGSLEIPLECKLLAKTGHYRLIAACGFIVDGGIYRHEFVASTVVDGMMQVQLETETPILSIVLTPHHFNEQEQHHNFFMDHFKIKGKEAAEACMQILKNQKARENLKRVA